MHSQLRKTILVAAALMLPITGTNAFGQSKPIRIGMSKNFFSGKSKVIVAIVGGDFKDVMKKTSGLEGDVRTNLSPAEVGQQLDGGKLDFGIFYGHEFAVVQKQHPELQALLIAANENGERAFLIVNQKNVAQSAAELGGEKLVLPTDARAYCRVFVEKLAADQGKEGTKFLDSLEKSSLQLEALNDVARGKCQAAIVDSVGLAHYKLVRGPVFMKNLKVLAESEAFPAAAIVHKRGGLSDALVSQFRDGLLKAQTTDEGRELMKGWKVDSFSPVPKDYDKSLSDTLKAYPTASR